jgi:TolA-binding protein
MAKTNQGNKGKDVMEDPNALVNKFNDSGEFFERNKKPITYILGAIVLVVAGFFGFKYYQSQRNETAQAEMYNAVFAWEKDSLKTALEGDKTDKGLLDISDEYSGTDAGNMATYYAGVAFLKQGKFDEAIESLQDFKSNDLLLQGVAYSLLGDAYMEKKELESAVESYGKAANYKPNDSFTPKYLMKLGLAQELNKDFAGAAESYGRIIEEFPTAAQVADAKKLKAKAEGLAAAK